MVNMFTMCFKPLQYIHVGVSKILFYFITKTEIEIYDFHYLNNKMLFFGYSFEI